MKKLVSDISQIKFASTAHQAGLKKVIFSGAEVDSNLTQLAYGQLGTGETVEAHAHPTMEEFFYFTGGKGEYRVGDEVIAVRAGVTVRIPPGVVHVLRAEEDLEFVYFGIGL